MKKIPSFEKAMLKIALPITLQSLLQSSFSVIDQVMIGQLGSSSIAGIGLGGKFASLYSVILAAIASAAGIMISQYMGKKDGPSASKSFYLSMALSLGLAVLFLGLSALFPEAIMTVYTKEAATKALAVKYLRILAVSFLPMAAGSIAATALRCMEAAAFPLYAGILALVFNTGLNYLLIFGKWGFPELGVEGAAIASTAAQTVSCTAILIFFVSKNRRQQELQIRLPWKITVKNYLYRKEFRKQYFKILFPLLICETLWSLGENVYTAIYGNMGTNDCAAMTITIPVQTIVIGALCGLSQSSGILIGKALGSGAYDRAYAESKKFLKYGFGASLFLSLLLLALSPYYVRLFHTSQTVAEMTRNLLTAIAILAPVKVLNMILGGGILRSGGKTNYIMWIDLVGTWVFGVPLGLLAAFVCKLPIASVYFILSLEECLRFLISLVIFQKKIWMNRIS